MSESPPLTLEQLAKVAARIDAGMPCERALERVGVTREAWEVGREAWLTRMALAAARDNLLLCRRYGELRMGESIAAERDARDARRELSGAMPVAPEAILSAIGVRGHERAKPRAAAPAPSPRGPAAPVSRPPARTPALDPRVPAGGRALPFEPPARPVPRRLASTAPVWAEAAQKAALPFRTPADPASQPPLFWRRLAAAPPPPLGPTASAPPPREPSPASAPSGALLTIEQLAWLHARLELPPHTVAAARERLGLTEPLQAQEEERWKQLLGRDAELYERYARLLEYYRKLLH